MVYLEAHPVHYNGILNKVTGTDDVAPHGLLPAELAERIANFDLSTDLLTTSLRGYQGFGAKFALVQRRTILGDEMGLGKTVEALAALCHLKSKGGARFLVIAPASVLANWANEIDRHTELEPTIILHGPGRGNRTQTWLRRGGTAITTFGTLSALHLQAQADIDAIVVDEAHYIKNPNAKRTKAVRQLLGGTPFVLLMTGTPMENRVDEFKTLVAHVNPQLASQIDENAGLAGADPFRRAVAPVYLRRNQDDVLNELPKRIDSIEFTELRGASEDAYRQAVAEGNFMAMRRAAFMTPEPRTSPKMKRILEIVEEAMENNRKVVVFSYFRSVIDRVLETLECQAFGPITGSVPASERQKIVDKFSIHPGPAVLVSQIEAGGVGLNIQAGSVVILTEPQWKPSTEDQAIARCHRMGQTRPVQVHRLISPNCVDEHIMAILNRKTQLFEGYVRESELRDATAEAIDVSDQSQVERVVSQAIVEREIIDVERKRLGVSAAPITPSMPPLDP